MKKAVLLHGTDGSPEYSWFPWLRGLLEEKGVEVWVPNLPGNHTPNHTTYEEFLKSSGQDFSDCLLIGHSSGATTVLNLLQSDWFPKVDTVILVGTFLNENLVRNAEWYEPGQFDNLFPDEFNVEKIKAKADSFYFLHGDDDIYCDVNDAKDFCKKVAGTFIEIPNGKHLSSNRTELSEIVPFLKEKGYL